MRLRSLLFVPGDSGRKFAKAVGAGADVLILDLQDAVAPSRTAAFGAQPDAGTLGIGGKMVDIPHLKAARRTLGAAGEAL